MEDDSSAKKHISRTEMRAAAHRRVDAILDSISYGDDGRTADTAVLTHLHNLEGGTDNGELLVIELTYATPRPFIARRVPDTRLSS